MSTTRERIATVDMTGGMTVEYGQRGDLRTVESVEIVTGMDGKYVIAVVVCFEDGASANYDGSAHVWRVVDVPDYADAIAQRVLDAHAIQPEWKRSGAQMRELLTEAAREGYALALGVSA